MGYNILVRSYWISLRSSLSITVVINTLYIMVFRLSGFRGPACCLVLPKIQPYTQNLEQQQGGGVYYSIQVYWDIVR